MAIPVLTAVARIAGPTIAVGATLPYSVRKAIMLTGINCREEIFRIRKSHISLLAAPIGTARCFFLRRSSSRSASSSMAFSPAGVAAQPSPRIFASRFVAIDFLDG